jgi:serine/threonine protein kinase
METLVFTYASDVWSFGVVLVEIFGDGEKPYHSMKSNADVMAYTMSGNIHQKPDGCSDTVYTLMARCRALDPLQRPPFAALAAKLERIAAEISNRTAERATDPSGYEVPRPIDAPAPGDVIKRRSTAEGYQLPVGTQLPRAVENAMYLPGADADTDYTKTADAQESMLVYDTVDGLPTDGIPTVVRPLSDLYRIPDNMSAPLDRASPSRVVSEVSGPASLDSLAASVNVAEEEAEDANGSTSSGPKQTVLSTSNGSRTKPTRQASLV